MINSNNRFKVKSKPKNAMMTNEYSLFLGDLSNVIKKKKNVVINKCIVIKSM